MAKAKAASTKIKPTANDGASKTRPSTLANRKAPTKAKTKIAARKASVPASKAATILSLLRRTGGASVADIQKTTDWLPHSVRGFLSGTVRKKMGLTLTSAKSDGVRTYRIAG